MKYSLRIVSLILAICIMTCTLTACSVSEVKRLVKSVIYGTETAEGTSEVSANSTDGEVDTETETETPSADDFEETVAQPESALKFCLTDADIAAYHGLVAECEAVFLNENSTEEELTDVEDRFVDAYYYIRTQSQIAYLWYCMDTGDAARASDYLFSSEASTDAYDVYMQLCKRMDVSDSPHRDRFFEGWTAAEMEEMRGFSGELTELRKSNDQILVQYRKLSDDAFYNGAADYYVQLVKNNNRIAELMGYDNYWVYAYEQEYCRDYGKTEVEEMRQYVRTYLVPLCQQTYTVFRARYEALSQEDRAFAAALLQKADYDDFEVDYVGNYVATFDEACAADMISLFEFDHSFFGVADDAHRGAYTAFLYDLYQPVCYFGPGYQGLDTVIHEMGHYYSYLVNGRSAVHMDLAEVQSQGNEWLFWYYMSTVVSEEMADVIYAYCLYDALGTVIVGTIVDEFEQICYEEGITTARQADAVMADVKTRYGGETWLDIYLTDVDRYWRHVTVEQSVYYVSYAISMLAAVQIYTVAEKQSYEVAMELYLSLIDPVSYSFMDCLAEAGLKMPMDEALYLELNEMMKTEE